MTTKTPRETLPARATPVAAQTFDQVQSHGPACAPDRFPEAVMDDAIRETLTAWNASTGQLELCHGCVRAVHRKRPRTTTKNEQVAYWPQKRLQTAIYGEVWHAILLRQMPLASSQTTTLPHKDSRTRVGGGLLKRKSKAVTVQQPKKPSWRWEICPDESVAIKMLHRATIANSRLTEDPLQEVAALQYLAAAASAQEDDNQDVDTHVLVSREVLQDEEYLYSVLPFCRDGDLFDVAQRHAQLHDDEYALDEDTARHYFCQILQGVDTLQRRGICHRDLSLENVLVDGQDCYIIDFGMCLRVPHVTDDNDHDNDNHPRRLLMTPQGTCGKWKYMSPEIRSNRQPFDGYAVDLWSVGVMLFGMLTGFSPYEQPLPTDPLYQHLIVQQEIAVRLREWNVHLSPAALDLLQKMLHPDPRRRLVLADIQKHPWVLGLTLDKEEEEEDKSDATPMDVEESEDEDEDDALL